MNLIRYMNRKWGHESIISGLFKVLRPLDANDPYEMMGACRGKLRLDVERRMLNDMHEKWEQCRAVDPSTPDWHEVERRIRNHESYFRHTIMERLTQQSLNRTMSFVDADKVDAITDQLMWAHYGENGSGFRIWFDSTKLITRHSQIFPVKYDNMRPCINLGVLDNYEVDEAWKPFLEDVILTKSNAWEYENEVRMLISSQATSDYITEKDDMEFISISPNTIVRVDFGSKGEIAETKTRVNELRAQGHFGHIDFRIATFDEYEYKYQYLKYDDLMLGCGAFS